MHFRETVFPFVFLVIEDPFWRANWVLKHLLQGIMNVVSTSKDINLIKGAFPDYTKETNTTSSSAIFCLAFLLILEGILCLNRDHLPQISSAIVDSSILVQRASELKTRAELCHSVKGNKISFSFWKWQYKWIYLGFLHKAFFFFFKFWQHKWCLVTEGYWKTKTSACS